MIPACGRDPLCMCTWAVYAIVLRGTHTLEVQTQFSATYWVCQIIIQTQPYISSNVRNLCKRDQHSKLHTSGAVCVSQLLMWLVCEGAMKPNSTLFTHENVVPYAPS